MKKYASFAAVMGKVWYTLPCGPMTEAVEESFQREFKEASRVRWVKIRDKFQARFYNPVEYCLAFFSPSGQLLMRGRKIPIDLAPRAVRKEMERIRHPDELTLSSVYELNNVQGIRYFINLESERLSLSILAYANGQSEIVKKINHENREKANDMMSLHYPGACR